MSQIVPESVWDYPRPPRLEPTEERVVVEHRGVTLCDTRGGFRVLETSHPPTYYLPREDFRVDLLEPVAGTTVCEFKGVAHYADLVIDGTRVPRLVWWYPEPSRGFESLAHCVALYPGRVDHCIVEGETVVAQEGDFYGGWITSRVSGPFKGGPGSALW